MLIEHPLPQWLPLLVIAILPLIWTMTRPDPDLPPIINTIKFIPSLLWILICWAAYVIS